ncbi:MAG: (d)CMP kinase [Peptostreptococcus porci]|uniref:(d)CMP kinase n=1 Tax=Peptostreptococcus porci TaxID=2652282 RepID=UPI001F183174|nr:(d)CMP kinase [Peptostreptococcus porci]MDD7182973.1 (d)CMP kinase [Peptostreptococcus porci]MDY4129258.1 (d)CMP kinase [Peptostreptococcus porci]MDY5480413.1 (d)CMP kinase [Peptostreptococcus porci]MDY5964303.1 (d)CMP kinase [Peptostreptococcus porci]MDY6232202.1 (d)CMP kinase [Peptostreptococcus porci]
MSNIDNNIVIAIDGPAGAGKSTVAKQVSRILNINYIDTGAMYRAITFKCIKNGLDLEDEKSVVDLCKNTDLKFENNSIFIDGQCVDDDIRTLQVSSKVSYVARIPGVRFYLVELQREMGKGDNVVLDGRDVGTQIFPNTKYKYYLNAAVETRAKRRYDELILKGVKASFEAIVEDVRNRDKIDSTRVVSPLIKASDAIEIDSTNMTIEEVVDFIVNDVRGK